MDGEDWDLGNLDSVPGLSPDSQVRHSVKRELQHWPSTKTLTSTEKTKTKTKTMNVSWGLLLKIK